MGLKIIISPAKKMNIDLETLEFKEVPGMLHKTEHILAKLQEISLEELQKLWKCNDKIAVENYERLQRMELHKNLTPAILAYEGIQYKYMAPTVFECEMLDYVQSHLRILSGFYGVLRPMDGVTPYRLEMQAKLGIENAKHLYEYWGSGLYDNIANEDSNVIINLASKEYSICIEKYLKETDRYITCVFGELVEEKVVQKGTYAKMARGEMVRFMAEREVEEPEELQKFDRLGYRYSKELSDEKIYVFLRKE